MKQRRDILFLLALWTAIFLGACFTPPLLDDADSTHAQAAQAMLRTHDFVILHVDGVRYLEKAPLPYWIAAASMALFGENAFAVHLPIALTVLLLALLGRRWAGRAWGRDAAFFTGLFTLTATGVFLFTRIFIPDALLALLLAAALYSFLRSQHAEPRRATFHAYVFWIALALAVLTKGLVALVFLFGAIALYSFFTRSNPLRTLRPWPKALSPLLFLAIAAPWHILAGLRNTGGANGHGFFWFYFVNEHFLRFIGKREPHDFNKLPAVLYWTLHIVWLFPWSLFAPAAIVAARTQAPRPERQPSFGAASTKLLAAYSALVLLFFAFSTNQEYYTLPAYLPLLLLLAASLRNARSSRWLTAAFLAFAILGVAISIILAAGLLNSRGLPFNPDIGSALAHRGVGGYTLSLSHFFDLTQASFAALRLPAALAAIAFTAGPIVALALWLVKKQLRPAIITIGLTMTVALIAAHIALVRFSPMLSSQSFAEDIRFLRSESQIEPSTQIALFGDQSFGSSIPFYLHQQVLLVDGRTTSMLFGSTFPDAPPIFLTPAQLLAQWGTGPRKILFIPAERRADAEALLGPHPITIDEQSGKLLVTDRPLSLNGSTTP